MSIIKRQKFQGHQKAKRKTSTRKTQYPPHHTKTTLQSLLALPLSFFLTTMNFVTNIPDVVHIPITPLPPLSPIKAQRSLPTPMILSSPLHVFRPISQYGISPTFQHGRDRFPSTAQRFYPKGPPEYYRYERFPGTFDDEDFAIRWKGMSRLIDDPLIRYLQPETHYGGIRFRISLHNWAWTHPVLRGDPIIFRDFTSDEIKYIVTWTIDSDFDADHAFVQVNAFNQQQDCLDPSDPDWPALGLVVPKDKCCVIKARPLPFPHHQLDPSTTTFPTSTDILNNRPRRNAHVWECSLQGIKQHFATLTILAPCGQTLAKDELEMD